MSAKEVSGWRPGVRRDTQGLGFRGLGVWV